MKTLDYDIYNKKYQEFSEIFESNMAICRVISYQNIFLWYWNRIITHHYSDATKKAKDALSEMQRLNREYMVDKNNFHWE